MARSKAYTARVNNLKKSENPQNPSVEDVVNEEDLDFSSPSGVFFDYISYKPEILSWPPNGHRTLPGMATKLKTEHEKKYGMQVNNV